MKGYRTVIYEPTHQTLESISHRLIRKAAGAGVIVPQPCEVCGSSRAVAHHDDYTKPYDIRWLCITHHRLHHLFIRKYNDYLNGTK